MKYLDETGLARLWEKIKAYVDSHSGGSGGSAADSFVVETYSNHSSKSVGTSGANTTYNITKAGYYPLGIVGTYISNANVLLRAAYLTNVNVDDDDGTPVGGATINYYMRSVSGTNTVTQTTRVLWVKI